MEKKKKKKRKNEAIAGFVELYLPTLGKVRGSYAIILQRGRERKKKSH